MIYLSQKQLKAVLRYTPSTGQFHWRYWHHGVRKDLLAGTITKDGSRRIRINEVGYYAGSLAWLWMTGVWPILVVDHKNTIANDDRWCNLRLGTYTQNTQNRCRKRNHKLGFKGVTRCGVGKKWYQVRIQINGKRQHLGVFRNKRTAGQVYYAAAQQHFGAFARV